MTTNTDDQWKDFEHGQYRKVGNVVEFRIAPKVSSDAERISALEAEVSRLQSDIQLLRGLVLSQKIAPWPTQPMMPTYPSYPWYSLATATTVKVEGTYDMETHDDEKAK
jgi:hypothetical protein